MALVRFVDDFEHVRGGLVKIHDAAPECIDRPIYRVAKMSGTGGRVTGLGGACFGEFMKLLRRKVIKYIGPRNTVWAKRGNFIRDGP